LTEVRIVLIGQKCGGKSSLGNAFLFGCLNEDEESDKDMFAVNASNLETSGKSGFLLGS